MLSMHGSMKPSHHTKQKRTHRTSLHPQAVALLLDMNARARDGAIYVFPGVDGKPLTSIKTAWRNLMVRSQIEDFRIHDLRHTFASRLISEGASLSEVGALLGHTQSATTFRYAHLSLDAQERTLARLASPRPALPEPEAAVAR
jgi:integrase